ncbi:unnamed protein product [Brassica rapa subsp. trilocularis]
MDATQNYVCCNNLLSVSAHDISSCFTYSTLSPSPHHHQVFIFQGTS